MKLKLFYKVQNFNIKVITFILLIAITTLTSACGIKPDKLEPPNSQENTYQQTYPDISTDPR